MISEMCRLHVVAAPNDDILGAEAERGIMQQTASSSR
jgi:hypothetical protein